MIIIDHVYKRFTTDNQEVHALQDITFTVKPGEFICLIGPSGCGKSTLLSLIAGLDFPDQGTIFEEGKVVAAPGHDRMMMFQESALFPWLNVYDNVLFGLELQKQLTKHERMERADTFIHMVGLDKFKYAHIHELSGGMKQRVALARALAPSPEVLLMDEPFGALDAMTRELLYEDLQTIWTQQKITILFVTHNVAEAACLGNRVFVLSSSPGKIIAEFQVNLPRPRSIRDVEVAKMAGQITSALRSSLS